jgi:hypothetical protein
MASMAIGAGISAIGGLIGAGMQSAAIKKAAGIQTDAANKNASLETQATDKANTYTEGNLASIQGNEAPYQAAGAKALGELSTGTSAGGQFSGTPTGTQVLAQDPGFDFRMQQGQLALSRAEAAGGSVGSGGALKSAVDYGQNFASGEYNAAYNRFMTTRNANYTDLAGIANFGQTANQVDATAGTQASGLVSGTTMQGTAAQTNDLGQAANATAAGIVGSTNAWTGALGSIGTAAQGAAAQYQLNQSGYGGGPDVNTPTWNPAGTGSEMYPARSN